MSKNNFELSLNKRGERADFSWLDDLQKILRSKFKINKAISLALVSQIEIKELNKVYRKKNEVTDVLSFNLESMEILGEVVICLAIARQQAKAKNHSLKQELQLLTIHGILHLLGYDHTKSLVATKKQAKQEKNILKLLNK